MSWTLFRKVWRDLLARRAALIALIMVMGFGIAALVSMLSVTRDLEAAKQAYFDQYRMADFFAKVKRAPTWTAEELTRLHNVRQVRGRVNQTVTIDLPDVPEPVSGQALSLPPVRTPILNDVLLVSGTWFSGPGQFEVLLNHSFAKANNLRPGSRLRVMLLDKQHDLLVVGTVLSPEFIYLIPQGGGLAPDPKRFGALYLEESFAQESCDLDGAYNEFIGKLHDVSPAAMATTLERLEEVLDPYGSLDANAMAEQISTKFVTNELENVRKSSFITPLVFLSVAALVLNVLVARLVQQQRLVIGTLKAIGYSAWQISVHYLCYGLAIGLVGASAGAGLAFMLHRVLIKLYGVIFSFPRIDAHFYPDLYILGFVISILAASVGTVKGVRVAVKLQPAEAMHPPPPEKAHHTPVERVPFIWKRLGFRWKMVFRSVFRNPFRSLVAVFAGAISTMMIMASFCMQDALHELVRYELVQMSRQDMTITLRDPRGFGFDAEERHLVSQTEPQLLIPAELSNGAFSRRVSITGLSTERHLYSPTDRHGRPVPIPANGLVLSSKLAEILDVGPGDLLRVQPLIGERRIVTAVVAGTVDTYLGLSAYADIGYLSGLIGEQWSANALLVKDWRGANEMPLLNHLKELPTVIGVSRREHNIRHFEDTFGRTNAVVIWVFIIFAMLIGFGAILNTSLVSLSERQREVGTLRVLGFTSRQVAQIFAGESAVLYCLGILVGLRLGVYYVQGLAIAYSSELFRFPVVIRVERMGQTALLMVLCIALAQYIVYRLVSRLDWLEVLKVKE